MILTLPAKQPFSLASTVRSHGWWQLPPFQWEEDSTVLTYLGRLASGRVVELQIHASTDGVSVRSDSSLDTTEEAEVVDSTKWMLRLEQDLAPFYDLARQEPKLAGTVEKAQGRILRSSTLFEDTVKTILTTNTSWSGTIRMAQALVSEYGPSLPSDPHRHAFPSPQELAASDEESLRTVARLGYRAPYVLALARSVVSGDLNLEGLRAAGLSTPELRKKLLAIKGVGNYAAAHMLMMLDHYDFVPVDSWAYKMVSHEWYNGRAVGQAEVEAAFERWGKWQGLAYWFWDWSYTGEG